MCTTRNGYYDKHVGNWSMSRKEKKKEFKRQMMIVGFLHVFNIFAGNSQIMDKNLT